MGKYLNPGNESFAEIRRDIYVDKTGLIAYINGLIGKPKPLVSFSRPRRFGKSYTANMLCAYYDRSCDSRALFEDLEIAHSDSFETMMNQYNVISFDVTGFIKTSVDKKMNALERMQSALLKEIREAFPGCADDEDDVANALYSAVSEGNEKFVFVIDEWDALFRECKDDTALQKDYILFLRGLFKNKDTTPKTIAAAYMTGILPIKKYGTESALSDFKEFTMTDPLILSEYVGFTETEVQTLCSEYGADFDEMKRWYDGYSFEDTPFVYSPNSVMSAIKFNKIRNYWTQMETFESLKEYIGMDFDGLRNAVVEMLGSKPVSIKISTFQNDMTSFKNKNDVLTLLIHLGYLAYDSGKREAYIPNQEVAEAFEDAVCNENWGIVGKAVADSERLLEATIAGDAAAVGNALEIIHESVSSVLQYNNESSLSCAITIAYYTAKNYYRIVREFPAGKGFADLAFIPRKGVGRPAMIVELKYEKDADTVIRQIHDNRYDGILKDCFGNLLLAGINYDKDAKGTDAKRHRCVIERV